MTFAEIADRYAPRTEDILAQPLRRVRPRAFARRRMWMLVLSAMVPAIVGHRQCRSSSEAGRTGGAGPGPGQRAFPGGGTFRVRSGRRIVPLRLATCATEGGARPRVGASTAAVGALW